MPPQTPHNPDQVDKYITFLSAMQGGSPVWPFSGKTRAEEIARDALFATRKKEADEAYQLAVLKQSMIRLERQLTDLQERSRRLEKSLGRIGPDAPHPSPHLTEFLLLPTERRGGAPSLTTAYLEQVVAPYLNALAQLQELINGARGVPNRRVLVRQISYQSPIDVSLEGVNAISS